MFELNQDGLFLCLFILLGAVLATCLHEFGHAIVAYWGGDKTVKAKGYLTLNPLKYTDVSTSLVLPIVFLIMGGFALPGGAVYINTHLLRGRAWKSAVSAAGPGMTALTALLLSIPFHLNFSIYSYGWFWPALAFLAQIEIAVLLLNLLPIPALDGYGILEPWLPENMQQQLRGVKKYGFLFLLAIFWTSPAFSSWFWRGSFAIAELLGIPQELAADGYDRFRDYRFLLLVFLMGLAILHKHLNKPKPGSEAFEQDLQQQQKANQALLSQQPKSRKILKEQGIVLLGLKQYQQAQEHYHQALTYYPKDASLRLNHGLASAFQGQFVDAIIEYDQVLEQKPKDYDALHYKADALLELKQYEAALALFDRILMHNPQFSHAWHDQGIILQRLGRDEDAVTCYKKAIYYDSRQGLYWGALAEVQRKLGLVEASDKTLRTGLRTNPRNEHLWQIKLLRLLNEHRYEDFFENCHRYEFKTNGKSSLPIAYQAIGLSHIQHYSAAIAAFEQALERGSHETWIRANRASCLIGMKCYEQALSDLKQLIADGVDLPLCREINAHGLIKVHRYDDAIAIYELLLKEKALEPEDKVRHLTNRGFALRKRGDLQAALASHDQALELRPENPDALSNRGDVLVQLGQVKAGLGVLDHCIFLKPEYPQGWKNRGDSLRELGQHQRAIDSYNQSLSIKPDIEILCDQAVCFLALEEADKASQALQKAQSLHKSTTTRTIAEKPQLKALWQATIAAPQESKKVLYLYWLEFFQNLELVD